MLAFLRGDPLQRAVHRAEDMGALTWHGGDFELTRSVPTLAGGGLDERVVGIESCENKILIQISCADLVWVAAGGWIAAALRLFLE